MAGACCLAVECDETALISAWRTRYLDEKTHSLDDALKMIETWTATGEAKSVGLIGNAADIFAELVTRGVRPDIVTDQTSAHDPIHGYLPRTGQLPNGEPVRKVTPKQWKRLPGHP